jgi:hypothetical protein
VHFFEFTLWPLCIFHAAQSAHESQPHKLYLSRGCRRYSRETCTALTKHCIMYNRFSLFLPDSHAIRAHTHMRGLFTLKQQRNNIDWNPITFEIEYYSHWESAIQESRRREEGNIKNFSPFANSICCFTAAAPPSSERVYDLNGFSSRFAALGPRVRFLKSRLSICCSPSLPLVAVLMKFKISWNFIRFFIKHARNKPFIYTNTHTHIFIFERRKINEGIFNGKNNFLWLKRQRTKKKESGN